MVSGGCLCGKVRYELTGPQLFGGFCYCLDCRKQSGSHSASMAVPEAALKITGETCEYSTMGDSGNPVTRVFCPTCGSAIISKGARAGVVMLKAGTLDDPEGFKPMASIYTSRAPSWDPPRPGLPAFPEMPPQG
jgi:hypothetical protein